MCICIKIPFYIFAFLVVSLFNLVLIRMVIVQTDAIRSDFSQNIVAKADYYIRSLYNDPCDILANFRIEECMKSIQDYLFKR